MILIFLALSDAGFTPRVIIPGVPTAGDNFSIICILDGVIERLAVTPLNVTLSFDVSPGGMTGSQSRNGSAYIREHVFNPTRTSDAGVYRCSVPTFLSSGKFLAFINEDLHTQSWFLIIDVEYIYILY